MFTCSNPDETDPNNRVWSADYNYPATGNLHFLAYTCDFGGDRKKPTAVWSCDPTGKYISGLSLAFDEALTGQNDITYSEVTKAIRKSGGGFDKPALKFHHAQTWVIANFIKTGSTVQAGQMKVRNVKVNNVNITGDLALTIASDGKITPKWTAADPADNTVTPNLAKGDPRSFLFPAYKLIGDAGKDFVEAAGAETLGLLLLPCDEQVISFEYCTRNGGTDTNPTYTDWITYKTVPTETTNTDTQHPENNHKWLAGKKYIYNFSVVSNKIQFTTQVEGFGGKDVNGSIQ